jgi:hypothetical protein
LLLGILVVGVLGGWWLRDTLRDPADPEENSGDPPINEEDEPAEPITDNSRSFRHETDFSLSDPAFYFLDFPDLTGVQRANWTLSPGGSPVYLLTYGQFLTWYQGGSLQYYRDVSAYDSVEIPFAELPSQTTNPPDNALVLLFRGAGTGVSHALILDTEYTW